MQAASSWSRTPRRIGADLYSVVSPKRRMIMSQQGQATLRPRGTRMPVIFAAHGAPVLLDDPVWMAQLAAWARAMPRPTGILMVSAHWDERPLTLGATQTV